LAVVLGCGLASAEVMVLIQTVQAFPLADGGVRGHGVEGGELHHAADAGNQPDQPEQVAGLTSFKPMDSDKAVGFSDF